MIVLFLSEPNAPHLVKKYTIRSEKGELFDLQELKSSSSTASQSSAGNSITSSNSSAGAHSNNGVGGNNTTASSSAHAATCMYSEMMACKPFPRSIKTAKISSSSNGTVQGQGGVTTAAVTVNSASVFNHAVDGSPGVVAHNAMMVPLKGTHGITYYPPLTGLVVGTLFNTSSNHL